MKDINWHSLDCREAKNSISWYLIFNSRAHSFEKNILFSTPFHCVKFKRLTNLVDPFKFMFHFMIYECQTCIINYYLSICMLYVVITITNFVYLAPSSPAIISLTPGINSIIVTYSPPQTANGIIAEYIVVYSEDSGFVDSKQKSSLTTSCNITGLVPHTLYYFKVNKLVFKVTHPISKLFKFG